MSYVYVIGTLEGAAGDDVSLAGDAYKYDDIQDLKVWRRAIKND
jgi:hypothetical protein